MPENEQDAKIAYTVLLQLIAAMLFDFLKDEGSDDDPDEIKTEAILEFLKGAKTFEDLRSLFPKISDKGKIIKLYHEIEDIKNGKEIPQLRGKTLSSHTMPIHRLVNELQSGTLFDYPDGVNLTVSKKSAKNPITTYVLATYDQPDGITMTGKPFTEYDRQVSDTISSLWEFGDESHIITPEMVFRAMTHRTQTEQPSPQQIEQVIASIEKQRRYIHVTIDATEEMLKRGAEVDGKPIQSCKIDDALLPLRRMTVQTGGTTKTAYQITTEPILLHYARLTKQRVTVKAELLDIKEIDKSGKITSVSISNSDARIAVKGYILRRIAIMKNDRKSKKPKQSNIILFDTIFKEAEVPQDQNAQRVKKYVFQVLDYYTAFGYIKGYTKRKKAGRGGGVDAVEINL